MMTWWVVVVVNRDPCRFLGEAGQNLLPSACGRDELASTKRKANSPRPDVDRPTKRRSSPTKAEEEPARLVGNNGRPESAPAAPAKRLFLGVKEGAQPYSDDDEHLARHFPPKLRRHEDAKHSGDDMDELSTGSDSDYANSWIAWFLSTKGNEYFCEVDEEYILDRFNLTGLNSEVHHYAQALDLITDSIEEELNEEMRDTVESSARHLYGLIHARFIITSRGLTKMIDKYKKADFGRCPRVLCYGQPLLPVGLSDIAYQKAVKLYCPRCEDIYSPKSSRHGAIDGAYFGSTFPHMLFMVHPHLVPAKTTGQTGNLSAQSTASNQGGGVGQTGPGALSVTGLQTGGANAALKAERYRPRVFGFQLHEVARIQRWQEAHKSSQIARLEAVERSEGLE